MTRMIRWRRMVVLCVCLGLPGIVHAAMNCATAVQQDVQAVIAKTQAAFVFIGGGSGAVISADGYMITNHHVIGSHRNFTVRLGDGRSFQAKVVGIDTGGDLALLRIQDAKDLAFLPMGDSDKVRVGEYGLAIGNPLALGVVDQSPTFTLGVISALHQFRGAYNDAIVTDAPVNPGNSGGPLVNMAGELIGVNGLVQTRWGLRSSTGLGYAIPSNQIKRFLPLLKAADGKDIYRGHLLGIIWDEDEKEHTPGARIKEVEADSQAAAAGFKAGDMVMRFDGQPVWHAARFMSLTRAHPAGAEVTVDVQRGEETQELTFKLGQYKQGRLGFTLTRRLRVQDENPRVERVEAPVAKAGLQPGDEIIAVQGRELHGSLRDKLMTLQQWAARGIYVGQTLRIRIRRQEAGESVEKEITYKAF